MLDVVYLSIVPVFSPSRRKLCFGCPRPCPFLAFVSNEHLYFEIGCDYVHALTLGARVTADSSFFSLSRTLSTTGKTKFVWWVTPPEFIYILVQFFTCSVCFCVRRLRLSLDKRGGAASPLTLFFLSACVLQRVGRACARVVYPCATIRFISLKGCVPLFFVPLPSFYSSSPEPDPPPPDAGSLSNVLILVVHVFKIFSSYSSMRATFLRK